MLDQEVVDGTELAQDDVFDTGSLPVPPADPDAHRGVIVGVVKTVFDSGATAIDFALKSEDVPNLETQLRIFPPKMFIEDIYVDKTALPEEDGNNQRFQYRTSIQNDDKTATVQEILAIAKEAGRTSAGLSLKRAENFDEYVSNLNAMTQGLEVVFVRRPGKDDFKTRLEVKRIYPRSVIDTPGKKFKGVRLAWEQ